MKSKKKRPREHSDNLKTALSEALDLPEDLVLDLPRITLLGNHSLEVENHKGIIHYTPQSLKVCVKQGFLTSQGEGLVLRNINSDTILIEGEIKEISIVLDEE